MKVKNTPYEEVVQIFQIIEKCAAFCGSNIYAPKFKWSAITYLMLLSIVNFFGFGIYTIWLKFDEDWKILFETGCLAGAALQGVTKFLTAICNTEVLKQLRDKIFQLYKVYENVNNKYRKILEKGTANIKLVVVLNAAGWVLTAFAIILIPVYFKFFLNERILVITFYVPKLSPDTEVGYISLCSIQSMSLIFGAVGNIAGDAVFVIHALILCLYSDIIEQTVIEFNEFINEKSSTKEEIRVKFKDIAIFLQEYSSYANIFVRLAALVVNFQIACAAYSAIFSIYITLEGNWPASSLFFLISMTQLYVYCTLGTLVQIAADKTLQSLYEIEWYQLDIRDQKMVKYMLLKAQNPKLFTVSGFADLSVNMALQVTKTVYSIVMMLIRFHE